MKWIQTCVVLFSGCLFLSVLSAQGHAPPFCVQPGLFDHSRPNTLGLDFAAGMKTITVFYPAEDSDKYCNGVVLTAFKGCLYAQWQSSARDEDAPDTRVVYSRSRNGDDWTEPMLLSSEWDAGIYTSGGWWTDGERLVAYLNVWPDSLQPKGGCTEYKISSDGMSWSDRKPLLNHAGEPVRGIFEQDPHALAGGRIVNAIHEQPGLIVSPYFTDDPLGIKGWTKGLMENLPYKGAVSREIEPSTFCQTGGNIVMIFRDQQSSFKKLASVSQDGITWSAPVLTGMPDSRSKQCAGNLPGGTAFMVNNPTHNKNRYPLVITLSQDGRNFDRAYLIRSGGNDMQALRYPGQYKRPGYHYPKAIVYHDFLFVSYATNKEDVEITQIPLKCLVLNCNQK